MLAGTEDERNHAKALGFGVRHSFILFFGGKFEKTPMIIMI